LLIFITAVTLFALYQYIRGKGGPEELALPTWNVPKALGVMPLGFAGLLFFTFTRDTAEYWRIAATVLWVLLGASVLLGPSYSHLTADERRRLARAIMRTWWVLPSSLAVFIIGLILLAVFASPSAVAVFTTVCLCGFCVEVVLSFLRTKRVLRETEL
jgi:hypothetical protein